MQRATVNGVHLEYEVMGEGPDVVWLHGMGGNLELERRSASAADRLAGWVLRWAGSLQ